MLSLPTIWLQSREGFAAWERNRTQHDREGMAQMWTCPTEKWEQVTTISPGVWETRRWLVSLGLPSHKRFLCMCQYFHEVPTSFLEHECQVHLAIPQWRLCSRLVWHQEKLLKNSPNQEAGQTTLPATSFGQYSMWWQNKLSHREKKNTRLGCKTRMGHTPGTRAFIFLWTLHFCWVHFFFFF